jgi:hypothetical protein
MLIAIPCFYLYTFTSVIPYFCLYTFMSVCINTYYKLLKKYLRERRVRIYFCFAIVYMLEDWFCFCILPEKNSVGARIRTLHNQVLMICLAHHHWNTIFFFLKFASNIFLYRYKTRCLFNY